MVSSSLRPSWRIGKRRRPYDPRRRPQRGDRVTGGLWPTVGPAASDPFSRRKYTPGHRLPPAAEAPNANAHMERWVGRFRRECLDRLLIVGRRQREHVLRVYIRHYNRQRPTARST
jgi:hypothetical protein